MPNNAHFHDNYTGNTSPLFFQISITDTMAWITTPAGFIFNYDEVLETVGKLIRYVTVNEKYIEQNNIGLGGE